MSGTPRRNCCCIGTTANIPQRRGEALKVNITAGEGLQNVLKSNLGPLGTIKMYVVAVLDPIILKYQITLLT